MSEVGLDTKTLGSANGCFFELYHSWVQLGSSSWGAGLYFAGKAPASCVVRWISFFEGETRSGGDMVVIVFVFFCVCLCFCDDGTVLGVYLFAWSVCLSAVCLSV